MKTKLTDAFKAFKVRRIFSRKPRIYRFEVSRWEPRRDIDYRTSPEAA